MSTRPESLFGVPTGLSPTEASAIVDSLNRAWFDLFARVPGGLNADLQLLKRYFHPIAQGARLRKLIAGVPETAKERVPLPDLLFFRIDPQRGLITPEGRIVLDILKPLLASGGPVLMDITDIAWANRVVADLYRSWTRERLRGVASTQVSLQLPVVAFVLTLLVNGSVGRDFALPIPRSEAQDEQLSHVLGPIVDAFVDRLRPQKRREPFRLRGGWIVTESTRRLFGVIARESDSLWIREGADAQLPHDLARTLSSRKYNPSDCVAALDALIVAYQGSRVDLASFGLSHERPSRTKRVRDTFVDALTGA